MGLNGFNAYNTDFFLYKSWKPKGFFDLVSQQINNVSIAISWKGINPAMARRPYNIDL